ncbi:ATP-binding protein [Pseudomonas eucalypticola]|uniref:ATP-binding protein n=1 Tax=Pseudomonas eucalypticola TaxID=2599595 RepID=A0A7D5D6X4_9PSED|nr:ATP-binding protein [Pseudomonas eucalypticola]QKZ04313.1 ATP-binding protein [Pseudomonas eucalypticola]
MSTPFDNTALLTQLERIANSLERAFPPPQEQVFDTQAIAYQWHYRQVRGVAQAVLTAVRHPSLISFDALQNIERQKRLIEQNTRQFVEGRPANNVLLTGARGTGKSSLVKACLERFHSQGLRLIEVDKAHIGDLPQIPDFTTGRPERFILFCDDLSFEEGDIGYKSLKTVLDGSVAGQAANTLIYATSNRRHLMAERASDNLNWTRGENGALNPGEETEEKISLSERFGLWISFYPFSQDEFLSAVDEWLANCGVPEETFEHAHVEALRWATQRGSRSGRIAAQFARDYAGRMAASR